MFVKKTASELAKNYTFGLMDHNYGRCRESKLFQYGKTKN